MYRARVFGATAAREPAEGGDRVGGRTGAIETGGHRSSGGDGGGRPAATAANAAVVAVAATAEAAVAAHETTNRVRDVPWRAPCVTRAHAAGAGRRTRVQRLYGTARHPAGDTVEAAEGAWASAAVVGACLSYGALAVREKGYPNVPWGRCNEIYGIRLSTLPLFAAVWEPGGGAVAAGVRALPRLIKIGRFLVTGCRTDCNRRCAGGQFLMFVPASCPASPVRRHLRYPELVAFLPLHFVTGMHTTAFRGPTSLHPYAWPPASRHVRFISLGVGGGFTRFRMWRERVLRRARSR